MSRPLPNGETFSNSCFHTQAYSSVSALDDESAEASVYELTYPSVDEAYASQLASKFGINGTPQLTNYVLFSGSQAYLVKDEGGSVLIDSDTGYFKYSIASQPNISTDTISDAQAKSIATDYLDELEMLPSSDSAAEVRRFPYFIDVNVGTADLPLPQDKIAIQVVIDGDGRVTSVTSMWTSITPIGRYPLISEAEAFQRLRDCAGYVYEGIPYPEIGVTSPKLVYIGFPMSPRADYLEPVYEFSSDDPEVFWNAWVPAVADQYLGLVNTPAVTTPSR